VYTARATADLSRMTDRLTDPAKIGKNSQHLVHSTQLKNQTNLPTHLLINATYYTCTVLPLLRLFSAKIEVTSKFQKAVSEKNKGLTKKIFHTSYHML